MYQLLETTSFGLKTGPKTGPKPFFSIESPPRTLGDSELVGGGGVATRFLRRVLDGVPAALNVLSVNLLSQDDVDLDEEQ